MSSMSVWLDSRGSMRSSSLVSTIWRGSSLCGSVVRHGFKFFSKGGDFVHDFLYCLCVGNVCWESQRRNDSHSNSRIIVVIKIVLIRALTWFVPLSSLVAVGAFVSWTVPFDMSDEMAEVTFAVVVRCVGLIRRVPLTLTIDVRFLERVIPIFDSIDPFGSFGEVFLLCEVVSLACPVSCINHASRRFCWCR